LVTELVVSAQLDCSIVSTQCARPEYDLSPIFGLGTHSRHDPALTRSRTSSCYVFLRSHSALRYSSPRLPA